MNIHTVALSIDWLVLNTNFSSISLGYTAALRYKYV